MMLKAFGLAIMQTICLIIAGVVHRVLVRYFNLPINNAPIYWGALVALFFLISFVALLIYNPRSARVS